MQNGFPITLVYKVSFGCGNFETIINSESFYYNIMRYTTRENNFWQGKVNDT